MPIMFTGSKLQSFNTGLIPLISNDRCEKHSQHQPMNVLCFSAVVHFWYGIRNT